MAPKTALKREPGIVLSELEKNRHMTSKLERLAVGSRGVDSRLIRPSTKSEANPQLKEEVILDQTNGICGQLT